MAALVPTNLGVFMRKRTILILVAILSLLVPGTTSASSCTLREMENDVSSKFVDIEKPVGMDLSRIAEYLYAKHEELQSPDCVMYVRVANRIESPHATQYVLFETGIKVGEGKGEGEYATVGMFVLEKLVFKGQVILKVVAFKFGNYELDTTLDFKGEIS